jgi:hypothetical protein
MVTTDKAWMRCLHGQEGWCDCTNTGEWASFSGEASIVPKECGRWMEQLVMGQTCCPAETPTSAAPAQEVGQGDGATDNQANTTASTMNHGNG